MSEVRARLFLRLILLTLLFAVPLAVLKPANDYCMAPKIAVAMLGAIVVGAVLVQGNLAGRIRRQPLFWPLVAWLAVSALMTPFALNKPQAIRLLAEQAGWALLGASALLGGVGLRRCLAVCAASLGIQLVVAVLQLNGVWPIGHGEQFGPGRVYATLGNPSFLGVYLAPMAVWFVIGAVEGARTRSRLAVVWALATVVSLFLLFRAEVKDAWAGLGVGVALAIWIAFGRFRRALLVAGSIMFLGAVAAFAVMAPDIARHLDYLKVKAFSWHAAVRLSFENPLTGAGPGGFQTHAPRVMGSVHALWTKGWGVPETFVAPHDEAFAHQDFLQMLAESGVVGFGFWILLVVAAVRSGVFRLARDESRRLALAAWLGSLATFALTSSFHFPLNLASSALIFWLALGWTGGVRLSGRSCSGGGNVVERVAVLIVLLIAAVFVMRGVTANVLLGEGYRLFRGGALERAVPYFDRFERLNPASYEERFYAGALFQALRNHPRAIESYERALELYPAMQGAVYNLGNVAFQRGDYARAITMYARVLDINPCMAEAVNNRGNAYAMLDEQAQARRDYARAVELKPAYVDALYNLAVSHYRDGAASEARAWVRRALEADPGYRQAQELAVRLGVKAR